MAVMHARTNTPSRADRQGAAKTEALVTAARALAPVLTERAPQAERDRRVSDATIAAIADAGIFQMLTPQRFGGPELGLRDFVSVMKELSPLCASTGWLTSFYIAHNWMWCLLPLEAQQEIFAGGPSALGPVMVAPTVTATPVEGGYRINGRAKWATGSSHASWCMVSGIVKGGSGAPAILMFAMPWPEARVVDTWFTAGMAATASNDVEFDNIFVPEHRTLDVKLARAGQAPGAAVHNNDLYRTPFTPFLCLAALTPLVATTRGVTDYAIARAKTFVSTYSGAKPTDQPALQIRLAKCELGARAAETLLDDLVAELEHYSTRAPAPDEARVLMRAKASYIANLCRDIVSDLARGSGASAHMADSPIQRAYRDLTMAACHVVFDQDPTMELHGKMLVGSPPAVILA